MPIEPTGRKGGRPKIDLSLALAEKQVPTPAPADDDESRAVEFTVMRKAVYADEGKKFLAMKAQLQKDAELDDDDDDAA